MKQKNIFQRFYFWERFTSLILSIVIFGITLYCGFRMMLYWLDSSHGFWLFVGIFVAIGIIQGVLNWLYKLLINKLFPVGAFQNARKALSQKSASYLLALWEIDRRLIKLEKYSDDFDSDKYLERLKKSNIQKKLIEKLGNRPPYDFPTDEQMFSLLDDLDLMILRHYDCMMNYGEVLSFMNPELELYVFEGIKKLKEEGKL